MDLASRLAAAEVQWARVNSPAYLDELRGTIGADPSHAGEFVEQRQIGDWGSSGNDGLD